jgi:alpha/beta superfamily hydrolase
LVRDLIEEYASDKIENGISIARFNMRGGFTKAMYEGGTEERMFAAQYRAWADASAAWPRTSAMLRRIAAGWEHAAERADTMAELDQRRDRWHS